MMKELMTKFVVDLFAEASKEAYSEKNFDWLRDIMNMSQNCWEGKECIPITGYVFLMTKENEIYNLNIRTRDCNVDISFTSKEEYHRFLNEIEETIMNSLK